MKRGIDYFPLDVTLDEKIELIEAEYGLIGFGVVVKLWMQIYRGQGYYIEWNDEVALLFARKNGVGGNVVSEIIAASVKRGIFDKTLYDRYSVLTSAGIQRRYLEAVSRRKDVELDGRYLLLAISEIGENVYILHKNADILPKNADISKQSKVEKSKVNKSKESVRAVRFTPPTLDEVKEYCRERGNGVDAEKFCAYYGANGWRVGKNPMKDWKAAVRSWEKNSFESDKPAKSTVATQSFDADEAFAKAMRRSYEEG